MRLNLFDIEAVDIISIRSLWDPLGNAPLAHTGLFSGVVLGRTHVSPCRIASCLCPSYEFFDHCGLWPFRGKAASAQGLPTEPGQATGQEELQELGFFASCSLGREPGP